jgi:hypothetical protein
MMGGSRLVTSYCRCQCYKTFLFVTEKEASPSILVSYLQVKARNLTQRGAPESLSTRVGNSIRLD